MSDRFVERLTPVLVHADVAGAQALLGSLEGEALREAKAWFARSGRWLAGLRDRMASAGIAPEAQFDTWHEAQWIVAMCAVTLCEPAAAARRVPWSCLPHYSTSPKEIVFVDLLRGKDRAWAADFVEAASHARLGDDTFTDGVVLSRVAVAVAVHHQLPCPTGPAPPPSTKPSPSWPPPTTPPSPPRPPASPPATPPTMRRTAATRPPQPVHRHRWACGT